MRFLILSLSIGIGNAYAQTPADLEAILTLAQERSPEIQKARARVDVIHQRLILAGQIPNPEVGVGNWSGNASSQHWSQTDISLVQPIELGGKRGRRQDLARAEINRAQVELLALVHETRLRALFLLYRLRQLNEELKILEETVITFTHLVNNYKRRPQLSPEQSTALFVFELALRDYKLLIVQALEERLNLSAEGKILTGLEMKEIGPLLPARKKTWPLPPSITNISTPMLKILSADASVSEGELRLAKADVWPTVSIGPNLTLQNQFGEQAHVLGFTISFPIPVLNQNDGARAIAAKNIVAAKKLYQVEHSVLEVRKEALLGTYLASIKVLEEQFDVESLHKRHDEVEGRFLKGLVTSPLVIESHRQTFQNISNYHERELKALNVYFQLVLMGGGTVGEV